MSVTHTQTYSKGDCNYIRYAVRHLTPRDNVGTNLQHVWVGELSRGPEQGQAQERVRELGLPELCWLQKPLRFNLDNGPGGDCSGWGGAGREEGDAAGRPRHGVAEVMFSMARKLVGLGRKGRCTTPLASHPILSCPCSPGREVDR